MNLRKKYGRIAINVTCIVCFAWLLAYALLWGISYSKGDNHYIKTFCRDPSVAYYVGGAFTILGGLILFFLKPDDERSRDELERQPGREPAQPPSDATLKMLRASNTKLKQFLASEQKAREKTERKASAFHSLAVHYLAYRYAFWIAIYIGLATGIGAIGQVWVDSVVDYETAAEPFRFIAKYFNSLVVILSAVVLGFRYQKRFAERTKQHEFKFVFVIGFYGVLASSLISILTLSPELIRDAWPAFAYNDEKAAENVFYHVPYFNIPILPYLFISKVLVFPTAGFLGGWVGCRTARISSVVADA